MDLSIAWGLNPRLLNKLFTNSLFVIWFGTHKDYDKINVETVTFDTSILNYKMR